MRANGKKTGEGAASAVCTRTNLQIFRSCPDKTNNIRELDERLGAICRPGSAWGKPRVTTRLFWLLVAGMVLPVLGSTVQLGPRPFYLVERMDDSALKRQLQACAMEIREFKPTDFSIGHRGAPLQLPEHTRESYEAAARMGAGILECDVTFTSDKALVCRHSQCDLHTTTNILATPLAAKCSTPFVPAAFDPASGERIRPATARCCTSDITLAEFRTLAGKMESANGNAATAAEYLGGVPGFRTELYETGGTLMTHAESIELFRSLGVGMTPELKSPEVPMPFDGFSREEYAQRLIDEYVRAGIPASEVYPQSFDLNDVLYWVAGTPQFGARAVLLDGRDPVEMHRNPPLIREFESLRARGVETIAPPVATLLRSSADGSGIEPSEYALRARAAGLRIVSWTVERSGRFAEDVLPRRGAFYYGSILDSLKGDGDVFRVIHALGEGVGVDGLFSDWPATTTFYDNCMQRVESVTAPRSAASVSP